MISFPTSPTIGQEIEIDGINYEWNGTGYVTAITELADKTNVVSTDILVIQDSEDSETYKKTTIGDLTDLLDTLEEW